MLTGVKVYDKKSFPAFERWIAFFMFLSFFLPYIKTSPFQTDVQPHFLIFFAVMFLYKLLKGVVIVHLQELIVAMFLFSMSAIADYSLKDSLMIAMFVVLFMYCSRANYKYKDQVVFALRFSVYVYFLFGIVQAIFGYEALGSVVANHRASFQRGFTSLASEPSFLGIVSLVQIVLLEVYKGKNYRVDQAVAAANLMLSMSIAAIAPAFIVMLVYIMTKRSLKSSIVIVFSIMCAYVALSNSDGRAANVLQMIESGPSSLLMDVSVANRASRSFGPLYASYKDGFIPHSMNDFELLTDVGYEMGLDAADDVERLSNIVSYFIYVFGFVSFPLLVYYVYFCWRAKIPGYLAVAVVYVCITNVTIATPYVILLLSIPAVYYRKRKCQGVVVH